MSSRTTTAIGALFEEARWELLPFASFDDQLETVPEGETIAITASPQKGVGETVDLAVETAARGTHPVVPHLAARAISDRDELAGYADRLQDAGITDIFVPGGDYEEPVGEFSSSYELLVALDELGYGFDEIGITGYPEGHPIISDDDLWKALEKKREYSTYIVTQICYDAPTVMGWIEELRAEGNDLPVYVGIPGVMKYQKLIGISRRVGVGDSIKFLRKTSGIVDTVKRMIGSRGVYRPDDLIDGLSPHADDPEVNIAGLHLYTFNRAADTVTWRQGRIGR